MSFNYWKERRAREEKEEQERKEKQKNDKIQDIPKKGNK